MKDHFEFRYAIDQRRVYICQTIWTDCCGAELVSDILWLSPMTVGECRDGNALRKDGKIKWEGKKLAALYNKVKEEMRASAERFLKMNPCPRCGRKGDGLR